LTRQFLLGAPMIISFSFALIASASFRTPDFFPPPEGNQEATEEFHRSFPLAANGTVSLENFAGTIRITTWERNEIKIDAVKSAYQKERLAEADINIDHNSDVIRIKTKYANENLSWNDDESRRYNNPASVSYTLTVPRNARLDKIELLNGAAEIEGVMGGIKASSVNAGFTLRGIAGSVDISTVNGRLEAILEAVAPDPDYRAYWQDRILQNTAALFEFLWDERFRKTLPKATVTDALTSWEHKRRKRAANQLPTRQIANAMAGVPDIAWRTSLDRCAGQPSAVFIALNMDMYYRELFGIPAPKDRDLTGLSCFVPKSLQTILARPDEGTPQGVESQTKAKCHGNENT